MTTYYDWDCLEPPVYDDGCTDVTNSAINYLIVFRIFKRKLKLKKI